MYADTHDCLQILGFGLSGVVQIDIMRVRIKSKAVLSGKVLHPVHGGVHRVIIARVEALHAPSKVDLFKL